MALQSSGPISIYDINFELGRTATAQAGMYELEHGDYVAINQNSPSHPNGSTPNSINEWYSYDHSYVAYTLVQTTPLAYANDGCPIPFTSKDIYLDAADLITYNANNGSFSGAGGGNSQQCYLIARNSNGTVISGVYIYDQDSVCWHITNGNFSYNSYQC